MGGQEEEEVSMGSTGLSEKEDTASQEQDRRKSAPDQGEKKATATLVELGADLQREFREAAESCKATLAREIQRVILQSIRDGVTEMLTRLENNEAPTPAKNEPTPVEEPVVERAISPTKLQPPSRTLLQKMEEALEEGHLVELAEWIHQETSLGESERTLLKDFFAKTALCFDAEDLEWFTDFPRVLQAVYDKDPELANPIFATSEKSAIFFLFDRPASFWGETIAVEFAARWVAFLLERDIGCFSRVFTRAVVENDARVDTRPVVDPGCNFWTPLHALTNQLANHQELLLFVLLELFPDRIQREAVFRAVAAAVPSWTPLEILVQAQPDTPKIWLLAAGYALFIRSEDVALAKTLLAYNLQKLPEVLCLELKKLLFQRARWGNRPEWSRDWKDWSQEEQLSDLTEEEGVVRAISCRIDKVRGGSPSKIRRCYTILYLMIQCEIYFYSTSLYEILKKKLVEFPRSQPGMEKDCARMLDHVKTSLRQKLVFSYRQVIRRLESSIAIAEIHSKARLASSERTRD